MCYFDDLLRTRLASVESAFYLYLFPHDLFHECQSGVANLWLNQLNSCDLNIQYCFIRKKHCRKTLGAVYNILPCVVMMKYNSSDFKAEHDCLGSGRSA